MFSSSSDLSNPTTTSSSSSSANFHNHHQEDSIVICHRLPARPIIYTKSKCVPVKKNNNNNSSDKIVSSTIMESESMADYESDDDYDDDDEDEDGDIDVRAESWQQPIDYSMRSSKCFEDFLDNKDNEQLSKSTEERFFDHYISRSHNNTSNSSSECKKNRLLHRTETLFGETSSTSTIDERIEQLFSSGWELPRPTNLNFQCFDYGPKLMKDAPGKYNNK